MTPLYRDPHFTFRFAEARRISRVHVDDVAISTAVEVFAIDPISGERKMRVAVSSVGTDGWIEFAEAIIVEPGDAFIVVPISV